MIQYPLLTEKAIGAIEKQNQLVFIVDDKMTKDQIKKDIEALYSVKVQRINTLNSMRGKKKAFVKLRKESNAGDLATKLKIM
ncbi:MAG: 50S ribosomal protein L23 [DPANN group archaeon]|nr:50S ribosomal protein L23 [DPANN group archaeon]